MTSPKLLIANSKGKIFSHPDLEAAGMEAGKFFLLRPADLIKLPPGSQLFKLPGRTAVGFGPRSKKFAVIESASAVAAFISPGYTVTYNTAYREESTRQRGLPLFSYAACASYRGETYVAAVRVDDDPRHDCRFIDMKAVRTNAMAFQKRFHDNRLVSHLAKCALSYGCPNAQTFFLSRFEAPLPTSPSCNAACMGCISLQKGPIKCSQPRIKFVPKAWEVAQIALFHIYNTKDPIVSFGQGCEGEPLLQAGLIRDSIRLIRLGTDKGTINMNTNGSNPKVISELCDAGLDSVRVSLNSAREPYHTKYYRPRNYSFADVMRTITTAKRRGKFVSLNYLTLPGFTDNTAELAAFIKLIEKYRIDMIQWRNLNYDPMLYFKLLNVPESERIDLVGIKEEMAVLKKRFPKISMGYFNPALSKVRLPR